MNLSINFKNLKISLVIKKRKENKIQANKTNKYIGFYISLEGFQSTVSINLITNQILLLYTFN